MQTKFSIHSKIADTLYGEILLCELSPSPVPDAYKQSLAFKRRTDRTSPRARPHSSYVAVKCVSLTEAAQTNIDPTQAVYPTIDDPLQERRHYNHFVEQDTLFFVSEYCAEGDLYQHLINNVTPDQRFDEPQSTAFMKQILHGVSFLHSLGIAHRDLSLENVLLHNGECKLSNFELSTDAERVCHERVGKAYYMAPEVVAAAAGSFDSKGYDPVKADVWSLGIMWFIMLTGSSLLPIASADQKDFSTIAKSGVGVVFTSWGLASKMSSEVIDLVSGMLRMDPDEGLSVTKILKHPAFSTLE